MKKILVAFDGSYYSESALEYAIQIARSSNSLIYGIFLEDLTAYHQFSPVFSAPEMMGLADEAIIELKKENKQNIEENITHFRETCSKAGIQYEVDEESGIPSQELIKESMYADLVITGSVTYFSNVSYAADSSLVSDLLENSHSPVLVVPEQHYQIQSIVLAFDGSASSIYAIKTFLYLFADFVKDKNVTLLSVVKDENDHIEGERRLLNYIKNYQPEAKHEKITGKPVDEILHFAKLSQNSLVVMGSFGRGAFSKLFKTSVGEKIVKSKSVPVYVAHE